MKDVEYDVSARGYLLRARRLLADQTPEAMFHAAFELRSGLEARVSEYLSEWDHVPKTSKRAWQIAILDKAAQRAFSGNATVAELHIITDDLTLRLFYTPVRRAGRQAVEKLGNYLHFQKKSRNGDLEWWNRLSEVLKRAEAELTFSVSGTLLGPALLNGGGEAKMMSEILDGNPPPFYPKASDRVSMAVRYHPAASFELPLDAYVWR